MILLPPQRAMCQKPNLQHKSLWTPATAQPNREVPRDARSVTAHGPGQRKLGIVSTPSEQTPGIVVLLEDSVREGAMVMITRNKQGLEAKEEV